MKPEPEASSSCRRFRVIMGIMGGICSLMVLAAAVMMMADRTERPVQAPPDSHVAAAPSTEPSGQGSPSVDHWAAFILSFPPTLDSDGGFWARCDEQTCTQVDPPDVRKIARDAYDAACRTRGGIPSVCKSFAEHYAEGVGK